MHARPPTMRRPVRRAGSLALILMLTLLMSVIGIAGLAAVRLQVSDALLSRQSAAARVAARGALELGYGLLATDAAWRDSLNGDVLIEAQADDETAVRVIAADPVDGDLLDDIRDPVFLTAEARVGPARQMLGAKVNIERGPHALDAALHAAGGLVFTNTIVSSDGAMTTNGSAIATSAAVTGQVSAAGSATGATYKTTPLAGAALVETPASTLIATYAGIGTTISLAALPAEQVSLISNGTLDTGITGWSAVGGTTTLTHDTALHSSGGGSLRVAGRTLPTDGAAVTLPAVVSGDTLTLNGYARGTAVNVRKFVATLTIVHRPPAAVVDQVKVYPSAPFNLTTTWAPITASFQPTYTGTLVAATLSFDTGADLGSFNIDELTLLPSTPSGARLIEKVVLSPATNPFGGGQNPAGVYVINCAGTSVVIRNCRIVGTLVLRNAGPETRLEGGVVWETAVANYPSLLVEGSFRLAPTALNISEKLLATNLNPSGTPYPYSGGTADSDASDRYSASLGGLFYCTGDLAIAGVPRCTGCIISTGTATVSATRAQLDYDARYRAAPPPGFAPTLYEPRLEPGSITRVVE